MMSSRCFGNHLFRRQADALLAHLILAAMTARQEANYPILVLGEGQKLPSRECKPACNQNSLDLD